MPQAPVRSGSVEHGAESPSGWRSQYCARDLIDSTVDLLGAQVVASHRIPSNTICEIRRIQIAPFVFWHDVQEISQIDEQQWWQLWSLQFAPCVWRWSLVAAIGSQDPPYPDPGDYLPAPAIFPALSAVAGEIDVILGPSEVTGSNASVHGEGSRILVAGPRWIALVCEWDQRCVEIEPQRLDRICQSYGSMEGVDYPLAEAHKRGWLDLIR